MTEKPMENNRTSYRNQVKDMGKKEFTLQKMQEYGFWPKDLPTPYERQQQETEEDYRKRTELIRQQEALAEQIANAYSELSTIDRRISELKKQYNDTWDYEKIRQDVARTIMKESVERRAVRKAQKEQELKKRAEAWKKRKAEQIVYIGKGYSSHLSMKETDREKLQKLSLPVITDDRELAAFLEISYQELRFLAYHRDVVKKDQYYRYEIPKKNGKMRKIAAPKPGLKSVQRKILDEILVKVPIAEVSHGFRKQHSVVTGAKAHQLSPKLLINMDLENFFPTITFARVRGLFEAFGYCGYVSSLLAMLCTYCERIAIEVKGETCYVKTTDRILPQGSPASPMLTNIICSHMDYRISGLAAKYGFTYTRYADDMSFSLPREDKRDDIPLGSFFSILSQIIEEEGFSVNREKTRILRESACQSVTGVVLNGKEPGVSRKWVKNFRSLLHHANMQLESSTLSSQTVNQILGRAAWLQSVNPIRYQKLIEEGRELVQKYRLTCPL